MLTLSSFCRSWSGAWRLRQPRGHLSLTLKTDSSHHPQRRAPGTRLLTDGLGMTGDDGGAMGSLGIVAILRQVRIHLTIAVLYSPGVRCGG